jgi:hypothetical protein
MSTTTTATTTTTALGDHAFKRTPSSSSRAGERTDTQSDVVLCEIAEHHFLKNKKAVLLPSGSQKPFELRVVQ